MLIRVICHLGAWMTVGYASSSESENHTTLEPLIFEFPILGELHTCVTRSSN